MIKTARQLKDLIRNLSREKSADAQLLMRNYMMERFLERISLSEYRDKFILKGGMLVAAMVGLEDVYKRQGNAGTAGSPFLLCGLGRSCRRL